MQWCNLISTSAPRKKETEGDAYRTQTTMKLEEECIYLHGFHILPTGRISFQLANPGGHVAIAELYSIISKSQTGNYSCWYPSRSYELYTGTVEYCITWWDSYGMTVFKKTAKLSWSIIDYWKTNRSGNSMALRYWQYRAAYSRPTPTVRIQSGIRLTSLLEWHILTVPIWHFRIPPGIRLASLPDWHIPTVSVWHYSY